VKLANNLDAPYVLARTANADAVDLLEKPLQAGTPGGLSLSEVQSIAHDPGRNQHS